jgi:hypothetical protein
VYALSLQFGKLVCQILCESNGWFWRKDWSPMKVFVTNMLRRWWVLGFSEPCWKLKDLEVGCQTIFVKKTMKDTYWEVCWMGYLLSSKFKKSLYIVFYWFWIFFDIVSFKTLKLLGHVWVVFDDVNVATNAFCQMQGFPFYDKHMVSNFVILPFTLEYVL